MNMRQKSQLSKSIILIFLALIMGSCTVLSPDHVNSGSQINNNTERATDMNSFVKTSGTQFVVSGKTFYFNGANQYYLFYKSHAMVTEVITDAAALGLTVIRTWGFCDGAPKDNNFGFQQSAGVYDEATFKQMDFTINTCKQYGIRLVIPLVNNWDDMGGMDQYVIWAGASAHDDFYTNVQCRTLYKSYVNYFLNRTNSITGVVYKNDPTIMMWELANEPRCDSDMTGMKLSNWINEMAGYIKSIDQNHLVSIGSEGFFKGVGYGYLYDGSSGCDFVGHNRIQYIDACSAHLYPSSWGISTNDAVNWIIMGATNAHVTVGKPYYLGEFGYPDHTARNQIYQDWYNTLYAYNADGAMFWLLSGHQDDGSLYPDYDGFTVYYPQDTNTCAVISAYSVKANAETGQTPASAASSTAVSSVSSSRSSSSASSAVSSSVISSRSSSSAAISSAVSSSRSSVASSIAVSSSHSSAASSAAVSSSRSSVASSVAVSSSRSSVASSAAVSSSLAASSVAASSVASSTAVSSGSGYAVNYTVNNDWGAGATCTVTIKNNSATALSSWSLVWTFAGNQAITQIWSASQTTSGETVTAVNLSYNGTIGASGGTQSFGFNLSYSGSNAKPASFTLNGSACTLY